jgi:antitoxin FitA
MSAIVVRNLPEETHRALRARAKLHARSTEAEVRAILAEAVQLKEGLGTRLATLARSAGGVDIDFPRTKGKARAASFE